MNNYILYAIGGLVLLWILIVGIKYGIGGWSSDGRPVVQPGEFSTH